MVTGARVVGMKCDGATRLGVVQSRVKGVVSVSWADGETGEYEAGDSYHTRASKWTQAQHSDGVNSEDVTLDAAYLAEMRDADAARQGEMRGVSLRPSTFTPEFGIGERVWVVGEERPMTVMRVHNGIYTLMNGGKDLVMDGAIGTQWDILGRVDDPMTPPQGDDPRRPRVPLRPSTFRPEFGIGERVWVRGDTRPLKVMEYAGGDYWLADGRGAAERVSIWAILGRVGDPEVCPQGDDPEARPRVPLSRLVSFGLELLGGMYADREPAGETLPAAVTPEWQVGDRVIDLRDGARGVVARNAFGLASHDEDGGAVYARRDDGMRYWIPAGHLARDLDPPPADPGDLPPDDGEPGLDDEIDDPYDHLQAGIDRDAAVIERAMAAAGEAR